MVDSGTYDDATLARRYAMAQKLMEQKAPVRNWAEGLGSLAESALGGYQLSKLDNERKAEKEQGKSDLYTALGLPAPAASASTPEGGFQKLAALLNGGAGDASVPPPSATAASLPPSAPPVAPAGPMPTADTSGKIYSNNEPSPLDPPVGADRAMMMKTILGEAGNEPQLGKDAVASVIRTRAVDGGYGGDTPSAVVTAKNQFEPWNTDAGKARMAAALLNPTQAAAADAAIKSAYGEGGKAPNDPTEGMTHFYSPGGQAVLGRPAPAWAGGDSVTIGGHVFNSPDDKVPANAAVAQGALPTAAQAAAPPGVPASAGGILAGIPQEKKVQIAQLLTSNNPTAKALGMSMITQATKQDTPINVGGKLVTPQGKVVYESPSESKFGVVGEDAMGRKQYGFANPDKQTVTPINQGAPANAPPDNLADLHGPEYMSAIKQQDPKLANQVQAIIEGRAPYPTGMLLKTPYGQALAQHVTQADPSFESGNATARVKTRNEFMTGGVGSPAGQITAGNTALQHAGEMSDALEKMKEGGGLMRAAGNAGIPYVSYWANEAKNKSVQGTPEGAHLNDFMTAKNHFSEEVTKFYAGSAGSEAERTRALANLDAAKSLPELRSAIKTEVNLMQGKVNALQDRWKTGMGPLVPEFPLIQPKSQEAIDRVVKRHQSSEMPAASGPDPAALEEARRRGLIK